MGSQSRDEARKPREAPTLDERLALTVPELANALGVSERHVREGLHEGAHAKRQWPCGPLGAPGLDVVNVRLEPLSGPAGD